VRLDGLHDLSHHGGPAAGTVGGFRRENVVLVTTTRSEKLRLADAQMVGDSVVGVRSAALVALATLILGSSGT
jgi:hypothetical protein